MMMEGLQEKRKRKSLSLRSGKENIEPNTKHFKEAFVCAKDTKFGAQTGTAIFQTVCVLKIC